MAPTWFPVTARPATVGLCLKRRPGRQARRYGLANQVSQALRAHLLLQRDVDYLVDGDAIVLVDAHTGRPKPDSIYQHGLQSAVEAREEVTVQPERETLAQISVAGFVSRYRHVAGITGTAVTAAGEFRRKYGLEVAAVAPGATAEARQPPAGGIRDEGGQAGRGGGRGGGPPPHGPAGAGRHPHSGADG